MTERDIAQVGHPVLRHPARSVGLKELAGPRVQQLIDDMIATMRAADGAGIAAPQVREPLRIAVIEVRDNKRYPYKPNAPLTVVVNPVLEPLGDEMYLSNEGCLSVPSLRADLRRFVGVRVRALDRDGTPFVKEVRGLTAGTYQHEVDHLDGLLFLDRVEDSRSFTTWEEFERRQLAQFTRRIAPLAIEEGA